MTTTMRFLLLLALLLHLAGCDRLVLRNDEIELPNPVVTQEQIQDVRNKVKKAVGDAGYRESNDNCPVSAEIYCATFKIDQVNAGLVVWVSTKDPSKLEAAFSSFGIITDRSDEAFEALRKAFQ